MLTCVDLRESGRVLGCEMGCWRRTGRKKCTTGDTGFHWGKQKSFRQDEQDWQDEHDETWDVICDGRVGAREVDGGRAFLHCSENLYRQRC